MKSKNERDLELIENPEYRACLESQAVFMRKQFEKIGLEMPVDYFTPLPPVAGEPINPSIVW